MESLKMLLLISVVRIWFSGETFWTCVECFATAKVAELNGELAYDG